MMTFTVHSGALRASDPCYKSDAWCAGTLRNVKNGLWCTEVEMSDEKNWGSRIKSLSSWFCDPVTGIKSTVSDWEEVKENRFGVDSGQFGFFDNAYFLAHEHERQYGSPGFYKDCCDATTTETSATDFGIIGGVGVVASSGYGDGVYPVYIAKNTLGEIIAVKAIFIEEQEENEDVDEEEVSESEKELEDEELDNKESND